LNTVIEWAKRNDLEFNADKCSLLTFRRGNYFETSYNIDNVE